MRQHLKKVWLIILSLTLSTRSFIIKRNLLVKIKLFGIGFAGYLIITMFIGLVVVPAITYVFSFWIALCAVYATNIMKMLLMVYLYDRFKTDWFLVELAKKKSEQKVISKATSWIKARKFIFIIFWSILDNLIAFLLIRSEAYVYNGVPKKMIVQFLGTILINTLVWVCFLSGLFS